MLRLTQTLWHKFWKIIFDENSATSYFLLGHPLYTDQTYTTFNGDFLARHLKNVTISHVFEIRETPRKKAYKLSNTELAGALQIVSMLAEVRMRGKTPLRYRTRTTQRDRRFDRCGLCVGAAGGRSAQTDRRLTGPFVVSIALRSKWSSGGRSTTRSAACTWRCPCSQPPPPSTSPCCVQLQPPPARDMMDARSHAVCTVLLHLSAARLLRKQKHRSSLTFFSRNYSA